MRFADLQLGDVFEAFGHVFLKMPVATTPDLPDANAVNLNTGRGAFFGATVPVEFIEDGDLLLQEIQSVPSSAWPRLIDGFSHCRG